jgi:hypothetical protein
MASYQDSVFLVWQDINRGIYFAEVKDGIKKEVTLISDMTSVNKTRKAIGERYSNWGTRITVDSAGNVYVLWVSNSGSNYSVHLTTRINEKWVEEIVVCSGLGYVTLPDMKVDKDGVIHLVYVKETSTTDSGCYYAKLIR